MTAKEDKGYPGLVSEDAYDDSYPDGVAGHVAAGARVDPASDVVQTPFGIDHEFSGADLVEGSPHENRHAGADETDKLIRRVTEKAAGLGKRERVSESSQSVRLGNITLVKLDAPQRLLFANRNRKAVVVSCVSGGPVWIGRSAAISTGAGANPSPNVVSLPTAAFRTFTHTEDVWVVGPANAVVDFVEENYV